MPADGIARARDPVAPVLFYATSLLVMVPAAFALMLREGAAWDWRLLAVAAGSAVFILGYNGAALLAYRHVAANRVPSAEYTGLIWMVLFDWWWFGEVAVVIALHGAGAFVCQRMVRCLREARAWSIRTCHANKLIESSLRQSIHRNE